VWGGKGGGRKFGEYMERWIGSVNIVKLNILVLGEILT
jgi:hypothetical protein